MKCLVLAAVLSSVLLVGCKEDPEQAANKLFVEAATLFEEYQALRPDNPAQYESRLKLLTQVATNLDSILGDYAGSSLAVDLASTGKARQLVKTEIDEDILRLQQSIPASVLMAETLPLWEQYKALPAEDPAQYAAQLKLLTQVDANLDRLLHEFPDSYQATGLSINAQQIKDELPRLQQSIPASVLMAETLPLWEQYKALPTYDPAQYAAQLKLLTQVDANLDRLLHEFPDSYQAMNLSINPQFIEHELPLLQGHVGIDKAISLVNRAEAQSSAGDVEGARSTLSEALKIARSVSDSDLRRRTLSEILTASAKLK
jgi:ABC-type transporter Mla MlaB component